MGLRTFFGRRRAVTGGTVDDQSGMPGRDQYAPPPRRHQADPATGELIRHEHTVWPSAQADQADAPPRPPSAGGPPIWGALPDDPPPAADRSTDRPRPGPGPGSPGAAAPEPAPSAPSGLVVGPAERREAPMALPAVYSAAPAGWDNSVVAEALDLVADRTDALVRTFYAELFLALGNEAFEMFPASMAAQRADFGRALVQWVAADDPDAMAAHLAQLGADHRKFDVEPRHYDVAGGALIRAWKSLAGARWTVRHEDAVLASYTRLASTMIDGAMATRADPASWGATVVSHERVSDDFAVLRLQPDAPYLFRPGQYLTVELGSRPHEWRQMSIASAPRADNTLDVQVRAVDATGVSAALVMHTAVGDRMRLGPPRGNDLVVEPGTLDPAGLLCLCSGTGTAPVSAVVESILGWAQCPPVHVFVGARTAPDLYPADLLYRLVQASGHGDRVHVHGVVSDDPAYTGLRGRVEEVVPPLKDWGSLGVHVLVSGPNRMIATAVAGLIQHGVELSRIHFDQYEVDGPS